MKEAGSEFVPTLVGLGWIAALAVLALLAFVRQRPKRYTVNRRYLRRRVENSTLRL